MHMYVQGCVALGCLDNQHCTYACLNSFGKQLHGMLRTATKTKGCLQDALRPPVQTEGAVHLLQTCTTVLWVMGMDASHSL